MEQPTYIFQHFKVRFIKIKDSLAQVHRIFRYNLITLEVCRNYFPATSLFAKDRKDKICASRSYSSGIFHWYFAGGFPSLLTTLRFRGLVLVLVV